MPYFTGDGSVGLFSDEFNDIYHSASGALTEAYEKFILPLDIDKEKDIKVLDICYGLGYNSKTFINTLGKDYKYKLQIDCLDINKELIFLSPFINTNNKIIKNNKIQENYNDKIKFYINNSTINNYRIDDWVNHVLIENLIKQYDDDFLHDKILSKKKYFKFFEQKMLNFAKKYYKYRVYLSQNHKLSTFLHNIYYWYLSKRYKYMGNNNIKMHFYTDDARKTIQSLDNKYDFIFLDAFSTDKCPQLWTLEFIMQLYKHILSDGVLVTYSNSALVRNTLLCSGFFIGKILDKNKKPIGTIASKNISKIKNKLNNTEFGLLKTKAGIPYRDMMLSDNINTIINNRKMNVKDSNLISSSKYMKQRETSEI